MIRQILCDSWKMRRIGDESFEEAVVPGSVYTDLLRNGKMEDPFFKDHEKQALERMNDDYEYVTGFACQEDLLKSEKIFLRFEGVDTIADIYLNRILIGSPENMHRIWEYEVKDLLMPEGNHLRVVFHSPIKYIAEAYRRRPTRGTEDAMDGFVHIRKAHYMFGWDWGAHLPDAGLFRPVWLLGAGKARLDSVYITQKHSMDRVDLLFDIKIQDLCQSEDASGRSNVSRSKDGYKCSSDSGSNIEELHYEVRVTDPEGNTVCEQNDAACVTIHDPRLWWPNGYGKQELYTVEVILKAGTAIMDSWKKRIGLRTITIDTQEDEWGKKFACQVNGVDIFSMGADYIPEDHLLPRVTPQTTRVLLEKAKWANFNTIRVWGGGYYPDDWFYDLCDELGLVVWQDFMFACAVYDLTPEFEKNIRAEFVDNIRRLRHHACLGLWCGNNEMESFVSERCSWVTKPEEVRDYLFMYERIIPGILAKEDPNTFYWPSSPSSGGSFDDPQDPGRGDVHYWDVWHGNKPFSEYRKYCFRFLSEFGFQSFPAMKTIETISDDPADYNIFSYIMEKHQRNAGANGKIMQYMQQTFRYPSSFETVLYASQLLQAEAIRYGVEHFRRNRGRCMGAVYWQLNDCWPVASWSSVDHCGRLKALHYYARRFFAPLMISCEEQGLITSGKDLNRQHFDEFERSIRLNVANESFREADVTVRWYLRDAKAEILRKEETELTVPALSSVWLDKTQLPEIDIFSEYVSFELERDGQICSGGTVIFSYPKYFRYEDPHLRYTVRGNTITVRADAYARSVEIQNEQEDLILSDNYFDLNGDARTVTVQSGELKGLRLRSVYDIH